MGNDYRLPWRRVDLTTRRSAHTDLLLAALLHKDGLFFAEVSAIPFTLANTQKNGILCVDPVPRGEEAERRGEETNVGSTSKRLFDCFINGKHTKRK